MRSRFRFKPQAHAMSRRRILFFTGPLGGGGAESHALRLMNHLDRNRFEIELAVTSRGGSYEPLLAPDIPIHVVSGTWIRSSLGRMFASVPKLRRLLAFGRYDLVCSLMDIPNLVVLAATAGLRERPAVVLCVQIPPSIEYSRNLYGKILLEFIRRQYGRADRIVALSRGVRSDLIGIRPALEKDTVVIYNACVDERLSSGARDSATVVPRTDRQVVVAVGRLVRQKGYDQLLVAFERLRMTHDAELWIVGEGPERHAIAEQAKRLRIEPFVRLLGSQHDPYAFMRAADVFVLASRYEGFGNVVVEALACGTPVVSTDCPYGPGEVITDRESGLLVPVEAPEALAAALRTVLTDRPLRETLIAHGTQRARDFHASVIATEYAAMFDEVIASHHAA